MHLFSAFTSLLFIYSCITATTNISTMSELKKQQDRLSSIAVCWPKTLDSLHFLKVPTEKIIEYFDTILDSESDSSGHARTLPHMTDEEMAKCIQSQGVDEWISSFGFTEKRFFPHKEPVASVPFIKGQLEHKKLLLHDPSNIEQEICEQVSEEPIKQEKHLQKSPSPIPGTVFSSSLPLVYDNVESIDGSDMPLIPVKTDTAFIHVSIGFYKDQDGKEKVVMAAIQDPSKEEIEIKGKGAELQAIGSLSKTPVTRFFDAETGKELKLDQTPYQGVVIFKQSRALCLCPESKMPDKLTRFQVCSVASFAQAESDEDMPKGIHELPYTMNIASTPAQIKFLDNGSFVYQMQADEFDLDSVTSALGHVFNPEKAKEYKQYNDSDNKGSFHISVVSNSTTTYLIEHKKNQSNLVTLHVNESDTGIQVPSVKDKFEYMVNQEGDALICAQLENDSMFYAQIWLIDLKTKTMVGPLSLPESNSHTLTTHVSFWNSDTLIIIQQPKASTSLVSSQIFKYHFRQNAEMNQIGILAEHPPFKHVLLSPSLYSRRKAVVVGITLDDNLFVRILPVVLDNEQCLFNVKNLMSDFIAPYTSREEVRAIKFKCSYLLKENKEQEEKKKAKHAQPLRERGHASLGYDQKGKPWACNGKQIFPANASSDKLQEMKLFLFDSLLFHLDQDMALILNTQGKDFIICSLDHLLLNYHDCQAAFNTFIKQGYERGLESIDFFAKLKKSLATGSKVELETTEIMGLENNDIQHIVSFSATDKTFMLVATTQNALGGAPTSQTYKAMSSKLDYYYTVLPLEPNCKYSFPYHKDAIIFESKAPRPNDSIDPVTSYNVLVNDDLDEAATEWLNGCSEFVVNSMGSLIVGLDYQSSIKDMSSIQYTIFKIFSFESQSGWSIRVPENVSQFCFLPDGENILFVVDATILNVHSLRNRAGEADHKYMLKWEQNLGERSLLGVFNATYEGAEVSAYGACQTYGKVSSIILQSSDPHQIQETLFSQQSKQTFYFAMNLAKEQGQQLPKIVLGKVEMKMRGQEII